MTRLCAVFGILAIAACSGTNVTASTVDPCSGDIAGGCPAPEPGMMTLCGLLSDAGTNLPIAAAAATGGTCTAVTAEGPCSLRLQFFDALEFFANPAGATPIVPAELTVDDCGRYRARNLVPPGLGFLAVAVDDAPSATDRYRLTVVTTANTPATQSALSAWGTTIASDNAWSASAGLVGPTFADRGVLALVFRYQGLPRAGVTALRNGTSFPADDYYFSDAGAARSVVDGAFTFTGSNGTALFLNSAIVNHGGAGSEPEGCTWPSVLTGSTPGAVSFQLMSAMNGGALCP